MVAGLVAAAVAALVTRCPNPTAPQAAAGHRIDVPPAQPSAVEEAPGVVASEGPSYDSDRDEHAAHVLEVNAVTGDLRECLQGSASYYPDCDQVPCLLWVAKDACADSAPSVRACGWARAFGEVPLQAVRTYAPADEQYHLYAFAAARIEPGASSDDERVAVVMRRLAEGSRWVRDEAWTPTAVEPCQIEPAPVDREPPDLLLMDGQSLLLLARWHPLGVEVVGDPAGVLQPGDIIGSVGDVPCADHGCEAELEEALRSADLSRLTLR